MPLQIQRPVSVYQLWIDADLRAVCEDHAAAGWLSTLNCLKENDVVSWRLTMQNASTRQVVNALTDQVVVSDLVTVVAQSVDEYNAGNPQNMIEEMGS